MRKPSVLIAAGLALSAMLIAPAARAAMRSVGAEVDETTGTVRLDRAVVERALATTPERFTLTSRNPAKQLQMGGRDMAFGLVAGPPFVHDCERGRRAGNYADYCDFIRLAHYFNAIHLIGNQVCAPVELPANSRHLDAYRGFLRVRPALQRRARRWG